MNKVYKASIIEGGGKKCRREFYTHLLNKAYFQLKNSTNNLSS